MVILYHHPTPSLIHLHCMHNFASIAKGILKIFASLINQVTRSSLSKVILEQNQQPEINYFYLICFENQILGFPNPRALFAFVFFLNVLIKFLFSVEYFYELGGDSRWAIRLRHSRPYHR